MSDVVEQPAVVVAPEPVSMFTSPVEALEKRVAVLEIAVGLRARPVE